jgi:hypothetical protein
MSFIAKFALDIAISNRNKKPRWLDCQLGFFVARAD